MCHVGYGNSSTVWWDSNEIICMLVVRGKVDIEGIGLLSKWKNIMLIPVLILIHAFNSVCDVKFGPCSNLVHWNLALYILLHAQSFDEACLAYLLLSCTSTHTILFAYANRYELWDYGICRSICFYIYQMHRHFLHTVMLCESLYIGITSFLFS